MHKESAVPKIAIANQVLRRSLISTSGAQRKTKTPGRLPSELMVAIRSTGTPAFASKKGNGVALKPTMIPSGRISRLKSQGAGGRCGADIVSSPVLFAENHGMRV